MDSKEFRGLMEAYSNVYAPQRIDEGLRSAVKRLLSGGKKEVEAPKPESRGEQLRKKYNVGPEKSDTSAKRQILDRSRARKERDEKEYGDSKYSKSVAKKSADAHDRYLKAGYSKYGADDARGRGNKARRRAAALNKEEFEFIVNTLVEEGYDLSSYTWDEMYEICLEEVEQIDEVSADLALRASKAADIKRGKLAHAGDKEGASQKAAQAKRLYQAQAKKRLNREEFDVFDTVLEFLQAEGYAETLEEAEWMMANVINEEAIDIILGVELEEGEGSYGQTPQSTKRWNKATTSRMDKPASEYAKRGDKKKEVAKYSRHNQRTMSLDHDASRGPGKKSSRGVGGRQGLKMTQKDRDDARGQAEYGHTGYDPDWHGGPSAPGGKPKGKKLERQKKTGVSAEAYDYVNEAQHARENPEKYEAGEKKKYAPVRGERTPMPPRGDKRREDFEKWYAKQMGR